MAGVRQATIPLPNGGETRTYFFGDTGALGRSGRAGAPTPRMAEGFHVQHGEASVAVNLYTFLNLYDRALVAASHLLDKGLAHAAANGISERDMLGWRLIDDMQPLGFQLMVVASFSCQWAARVAGLPVPDRISPDLDAAGFRKAIAEAREYLAALKPEQFAGRDDVPLTVQITEGLEPTLPAGQWLSSFATTNIHFHLSTLYGILRAHGVPIGKADLFAGGL